MSRLIEFSWPGSRSGPGMRPPAPMAGARHRFGTQANPIRGDMFYGMRGRRGPVKAGPIATRNRTRAAIHSAPDSNSTGI